jgi:hypothetical protein
MSASAEQARQRSLAGLHALLLSVCLSGCAPRLSAEECDALLARYTERLIEQTRPSTSPGEVARLVEETQAAAARDPAFAACAEELSRGQFECAMSAPSVDAMERCLL